MKNQQRKKVTAGKSKAPETSPLSRDSKHGPAATPGAPIPGFEEDDEYQEYVEAGLTFAGTMDTNADLQNDEGNDEIDAGSPIDSDSVASAKLENDPDVGMLGSPDLRFGGEDISGVSEWSMRARDLKLDDGLDAGDYRRPDVEIAEDIFEAFQEGEMSVRNFECEVTAAEVTLRGRVESASEREKLESMVKDMPGVKEVINLVEVSAAS